jgi:multidrug efflux pump subunit AcrA (membrane-fusion protein)
MYYKDRSVFKIIVFVFLASALVLTSCASSTANSSVTSEGVVSSVTITDKIETSGNLSAGQLVQMTWATDGLIEQVNVKVGQKVKEGDILAALKADSVTTDMITAQADLATAQRDLEDLVSSNLTATQAQQSVLTTREAVETAQNNLDGLAYPRASDALIKNTQAKIWDAQKTLTLAYKQYKEVQHHVDGDPQKTSALLALTQAQLDLNTLVTTYNWYTAKPNQSDYDDAKAALDVARANWEDAKRKRDIVKNGADPLALAAAKAKVAAAQAVVNGIQTIAPFDGEVIAVQAVSGDAVKQGNNSVAMVDRNTLKVDTQIDETSISTVTIGDNAEVTMDSLPGVTLKGKVTLINPIGATVNGLVKYTVTISLDPSNEHLLFGATANVVIITGAPHTMLAVPVSAVQSDSKGEYVVVAAADGSTQRVDVTSGDLSGSLVTITTKGKLAEGDTVELGTSSSSSSSSSSGTNRGGGGIIPGAGGPPGG